ncbi:MAG: hypothetical protein ABW154_13445 [Dyella sp.]
MASRQKFPQADFLDQLRQVSQTATMADGLSLMPQWAQRHRQGAAETGAWQLTQAGEWLLQVLTAKQALAQAAFDTELAADELRRYQKFAKPGQPWAHIVQLRQKQAAARQASHIAKQAFLKAAAQLVRGLPLDVPPRMTLEVFVQQWIDNHVPRS